MSSLTSLLQHKVKKSSKKPLRWLRKATLADRPVYHGPLGEREIFPCDFFSSGGRLKIVETFISESIDPSLEFDTEGSVLHKKKLMDIREDSRAFIHKATHCSDNYVVIFTDGRSFFDVFLSYMKALDIPRMSSESRRPPVILLGHDLATNLNQEVYNIGAEAAEIQIGEDGGYSLKKIEALLKFYKKQERAVIAAFSVGDAITGILNDIQQITAMLHSYNALVVWDFSSAGAYAKVDMSPLVSYNGLTCLDAAFIRTDKFLGGEEASGVFITKVDVLTNPMFETAMEGVIVFSCVDGALDKSRSASAEVSYEAKRRLTASPLRARAAFELKGYFGDCYLQNKTLELSESISRGFLNNSCVHVIRGSLESSSLPFLSLFFFHSHTEWALHHGFIIALLIDLFGIAALYYPTQPRHLPSVPKLESQRTMHAIMSMESDVEFPNEKVMQVGCVHFSLMYFMRDIDLDFLATAIRIVAEDGWRLLPFYRFNVTTGKWITPHNLISKTEILGTTMAKLRSIQYQTQSVRHRHAAYLERAKKLLQSITDKVVRKTLKGQEPQGDEGLSDKAKDARWFMTPAEARDLLDDASPVRISNTVEREKRRTWPGTTGSPLRYNFRKRLA